MVQDRHKVWVAPKRRPRASGSQEPEKVTKGFVEFQPSGVRGISLVSLTGSVTSDVGDLEEIRGALPESAPTPTKGPKSVSSGLTGHERITSETIVRIHADAQGGVSARRQDIKPGTAYYMKRKPEEPGNVKYTSQVRAIWRPSVSVEAASISGSEAADPPVLTNGNWQIGTGSIRAEDRLVTGFRFVNWIHDGSSPEIIAAPPRQQPAYTGKSSSGSP